VHGSYATKILITPGQGVGLHDFTSNGRRVEASQLLKGNQNICNGVGVLSLGCTDAVSYTLLEMLNKFRKYTVVIWVQPKHTLTFP
jgi:hypothetical protein